jgi:hypothetical protein
MIRVMLTLVVSNITVCMLIVHRGGGEDVSWNSTFDQYGWYMYTTHPIASMVSIQYQDGRVCMCMPTVCVKYFLLYQISNNLLEAELPTKLIE